MASPILELIAREHPAFVHVPLGLVVVLPLTMLASFRPKHAQFWTRTSFAMACVALASSVVALGSGLLWARQLSLVGQGEFLPKVVTAAQVLQRILQLHEFAALSGVVVGALCVWLTWRNGRPGDGVDPDDVAHHRRHQLGRRLWERGVGLPALLASLLWVGAWGFCGRLGGIMIFGNEETAKAAAEAEARRKADVERDLPIRALDYASLEPAGPALVKSEAHGQRWQRIWVTASGIDAYKAGKPLPEGAYAVVSTFEDAQGKAGHEAGPLYMKETKADGSTAYLFYWPRVPEAQRAQVGGEDSVYWRSPDPHLQACVACHDKGKR